MTGSQSFDRVAQDYDRLRGGLERGRQSASALARDLVPGSVLEVGTGTGVVLVGLAELGWTVTGVDIAEEMLAIARQRLGDRVRAADAQQLPFPDDSFDNVVFVHVLHLVGSMSAALAEAARVLAPGGRIVAVHGEPAADPDDLTAALDRLRPLRTVRPDTPQGLTAVAEQTGLKVLRQEFLPEYERATSPAELTVSIETRLPPFLWNVGAEDWTNVVEPVLAELAALPDQDRKRVQRWRVHRSVLSGVG